MTSFLHSVFVFLFISQAELVLVNSHLKNVFIAVSTTEKHHSYILPIIVRTWFTLAKENTWFFTNIINEWIKTATNDHMVVTDCESCIPSTKECLCNQIQSEIMYYYDHYETKWFCHFDDVTFVNIPGLAQELRKYNHTADWYLGRRYIAPYHEVPHEETFWFGRLAAGCCISRSLMMKLKPRVCRKNFLHTCMSLESVDQALGFVIEGEGVQLTNVPTMHDNMEDLSAIKTDDLRQQITLSYKDNNVVNVPGFNNTVDPTRFLSMHCFYLLPYPAYEKANFCIDNNYKKIVSAYNISSTRRNTCLTKTKTKSRSRTTPLLTRVTSKRPRSRNKTKRPRKTTEITQTTQTTPDPVLYGMFGYLF